MRENSLKELASVWGKILVEIEAQGLAWATMG